MEFHNLNWNRQRTALLIAIIVLSASLYMLTFSARIESTDTLFMFDATGSWVRFGDMYLDLTAGERRFWNYETVTTDWPLLPVDAEPLQIILASPLFWLAEQLPHIGHVHMVWLFNVLITSASIGLFFVYVLRLGGKVGSAVVLSLMLATGTILWPYSKTFFQEPLTLLGLLSTALVLDVFRQTRQWRWLLLSIMLFGLGVVARRSILIALPALMLIVMPYMERLFATRPVRLVFTGGFIVFLALLYYNTIPQSAQEIGQLYRNEALLESIPWDERMLRASINQGIQGYLFAPGGSFWATSPIVLLAFVGMAISVWRGMMRYVLVSWVLVLSYALIYAYVANDNWFGGLSWPPRFLVPTIPFVMLCALPVVDWLLEKPKQKWWAWVSVTILFMYSLWIQFNGVSYWWGEYAPLLPDEAAGFTEWRGGLNIPQYFRWVLLPQLWDTVPFDFIWIRTGIPYYMMVFAGLIVLSLWVIRWIVQHDTAPNFFIMSLLPLLWLGSTGLGLVLAYEDDFYLGFSEGLDRAATFIASELTADDVVLIAELGHERYFLNYGQIKSRIISLPEHPGEQPSPDQPPQIVSPLPADLLEKPTLQMIEQLAHQYPTLWILADSSPFVSWSVLPLERYMAQHYHLIQAIDFTGADGLPVRLLAYDMSSYQNPYDLAGATIPTSFAFDEIRLLGYSLPQGESYHAGQTIPISLYWTAPTPQSENYTVALHLAAVGGGVVASAQDMPPVAGFMPTYTWQPNAPIVDNRALQIPAELPDGTYQLWVTLYYVPNGNLQNLTVSGGDTVDDILAVLPTVIHVENITP